MNRKKETAKQEKETALNNWHPEKITLAKRFIDEEQTQKSRNLSMKNIHLCELGENIGSEQANKRPVLIVSNDRINSSSTNVTIIPLTTNLKKKTLNNGKTVPRLQTHYFLKKQKYTFLDRESATMAEGVRAISKIRIGKHLGEIDNKDFKAIMKRLKWVFDFD